MGSCILTFDQMQILAKKSDSRHSDNDWLIVTWFVGPNNVRTDKVPLRNQAASVVLDSGDTIQPVSLSVDCADGDLVTATFEVVNLGSTDFSDQVQAAADIGKEISETVAKIYLKAAEEIVRYGVPLGRVFADGIEQVEPVIVSSIGAAWDDIIVPLVDDVIELLQKLVGRPNCNGDVLHDMVVFMPFEPKDPQTWTHAPYVASSKSGCGSAASTSVVFTRDRVLDSPMQFSNTPPPATETTPVQDGSLADWVGRWAEDPGTPSPIVFVDIEPSHAASGSLAVTIVEHVDRRFGAEFDGGGDVLFPHSHRVVTYYGNVFGAVRPWYHATLKPGDLALKFGAAGGPQHPIGGPHGGAEAAGREIATAVAQERVSNSRQAEQASQPTRSEALSFGLTWQRPVTTSPMIPVTTMLRTAGLGVSTTPDFVEMVDAISIPTQGVLLCLYVIKQDGRTIGHALRYIREQNLIYTNADVILAPWSPIG